MKPVLEIVNEDLFYSKLNGVDLSGLKSREYAPNRHYWVGDITLDLKDVGHVSFDGEHNNCDFEEDYGFDIWPEAETPE
jgi:hypothetical protein